jgi:hypothetical protein
VIAVIGIDGYHHWRRLSNAVRDAQGAAALFEQLGFQQRHLVYPRRALRRDGGRARRTELPGAISAESTFAAQPRGLAVVVVCEVGRDRGQLAQPSPRRAPAVAKPGAATPPALTQGSDGPAAPRSFDALAQIAGFELLDALPGSVAQRSVESVLPGLRACFAAAVASVMRRTARAPAELRDR